jgi:hypothetical protein
VELRKVMKQPAFWVVGVLALALALAAVVQLSGGGAAQDADTNGSDEAAAGDVDEGDALDVAGDGTGKSGASDEADGADPASGPDAGDSSGGGGDDTSGGTGGSSDDSGAETGGETSNDPGLTDPGDPGDDPAPAPQDGLTAVAFLEDIELARPQTYRVELVVLGRQDAGGGLVYATVEAAELLGPIDASTGEPMGEPDPDEPDHSSRLESLTVLATATEAALGDLGVGSTETVQLILLPVPGGATLHVDRVL